MSESITYDSNQIKDTVKSKVVSILTEFDDSQLRTIQNALDFALYDYDLKPIKNEIVVRQMQDDNKLIELFLIQKKIEGCSDRTIKCYRLTLYGELHRYVKKSCLEMTKEDIRYYLAKKMIDDPNLSMTTLNNNRRVFSSFFAFLADNDYIPKNIMRSVKKIKETKTVKKPFTNEELELMRKKLNERISNAEFKRKHPESRYLGDGYFRDSVARAKRNLAIFEFLVSTGCRVSELCTSKLSELDLINGEIKVFGKGSKERVCYLSSSCIVALKQYLDDDLIQSIIKHQKKDWLFIETRDGTRYTQGDNVKISMVEIILRDLGRSLGIPKVYPHRFRRTTATNLLRKGMKIEEVQKVLGHENIDTTMIYAQVDVDDVKAKHRKLMG